MTLFTHNLSGLQPLEIPSASHRCLVELLGQWARQHEQAVFLTEQTLLGHSAKAKTRNQALEAGYLKTSYEDAKADGLGRGSQSNLKRLAAAQASAAAHALEQLRPGDSYSSPGDSPQGFTLLLMEGFMLLLQVGLPSPVSETGLERLATFVAEPDQLAEVGQTDSLVPLSLTFEPAVIEAFVQELLIRPMTERDRQGLANWLARPRGPNRPELQSHFTLLLLQQLMTMSSARLAGLDSSTKSVNAESVNLEFAQGTASGSTLEDAIASGEVMRVPQVAELPDELDSQLPALEPVVGEDELSISISEQSQTPFSLRIQELTRELQEAWETAHAAEQAKAEFLAMMSHELRTPLTCVIGMSATMLRWSFGDLNDRQRDYLQSIYDSGEHLLQLIESILDFSQAESGQAKLQMRHFSLRRLVSYCVQLFKESAEHANLHLETVFALTPEEDEFVADPQRLRQILINLLDNAVKFTPAGGQITLRVSSKNGGVLLQVVDTGIGIEPLKQSLLFKKFQQLDRTHQRRYQGSGLGLALTKHQVDLHQGTIEVESVLGEGSAFNVWLPAQRLPAPIPAGKLQGTVVLLEDDDQSAALLCELLTASGFKVVWLVESSTALEQILELQPLAAIVDLEIQGGSGDEIIRHIHQASFEHQPKIIALSSLEEDAEEFLLPEDPVFRADAYLFRPIQPEDFVARLQSLVAEAA